MTRKYVRHPKVTWEQMVAAVEKFSIYAGGHDDWRYEQLGLPLRSNVLWYSIKRKRAVRKATPPWANREKIAAVYDKAFRLTNRTGIKHSVDHIIPIQHPKVCGLHVHANLRVLTAQENSRKHNSFCGPAHDR